MTKTEMLQRMSSAEITEWKMYYRQQELEREHQKTAGGKPGSTKMSGFGD